MSIFQVTVHVAIHFGHFNRRMTRRNGSLNGAKKLPNKKGTGNYIKKKKKG